MVGLRALALLVIVRVLSKDGRGLALEGVRVRTSALDGIRPRRGLELEPEEEDGYGLRLGCSGCSRSVAVGVRERGSWEEVLRTEDLWVSILVRESGLGPGLRGSGLECG